MNVQNLRDNYPKLIFCLENNSYSKTYVDRFKREIKNPGTCRFRGLVLRESMRKLPYCSEVGTLADICQ